MSKNNSSVHQPHDKLVKKLLSNPATARDILSLYLPKEVLGIVNLDHLELQKDSFIDDEHRAYAVDLLYKTKFKGNEGYLWLLLEHQRKSEYWMPVRVFKYIAVIWDHIRKLSKGEQHPLPLVYPLIIYNGDTPYAHSLTLSDLIETQEAKDIFSTLFTRPFSLVDLPAVKDEDLRKAAQDKIKGVALLMALKHVLSKDLQSYFDRILFHIIKQLERGGDTEEVVDIMYYLLNEGKFIDSVHVLNKLHGTFSADTEEKIMTAVEQWKKMGREEGIKEGIERGIEQGIEQGIEKNKIEVAKKLLTEKTGLNNSDLMTLIKHLTGLSDDQIQELRKKH